jgi:hypothetical protein
LNKDIIDVRVLSDSGMDSIKSDPPQELEAVQLAPALYEQLNYSQLQIDETVHNRSPTLSERFEVNKDDGINPEISPSSMIKTFYQPSNSNLPERYPLS